MSLELAKKYFSFWASKDIDSLSHLIANTCVLDDWENYFESKSEILDFYQNVFLENNIQLKILNMSENNSIVYTHLYLVINNLEIEVVDILTFKNNKITNIKAFKK